MKQLQTGIRWTNLVPKDSPTIAGAALILRGQLGRLGIIFAVVFYLSQYLLNNLVSYTPLEIWGIGKTFFFSGSQLTTENVIINMFNYTE